MPIPPFLLHSPFIRLITHSENKCRALLTPRSCDSQRLHTHTLSELHLLQREMFIYVFWELVCSSDGRFTSEVANILSRIKGIIKYLPLDFCSLFIFRKKIVIKSLPKYLFRHSN